MFSMKTFRCRLLTLLLLTGLVLLPLGGRAGQVGKEFPVQSLSFVDEAPALKGKPAIIEFWATYCAPCIKLIPHLNAIYAKQKAKGLVVVGVSQDFIKTDIAKFRQKTPIDYPVAFDDEMKLGAKMGVDLLPWAFVLDRSGKIVWEGLSSEMTDEIIEKAMK